MHVQEKMTRQPVTIAPDAPLALAFERMEQGGFRHLPVVDGDALMGMLSDRDLRLYMVATRNRRNDPASTTMYFSATSRVLDAMTPLPLTVSPGDDVAEAAKRMLLAKVNALCVIDGEERLVGIITTQDLLDLID